MVSDKFNVWDCLQNTQIFLWGYLYILIEDAYFTFNFYVLVICYFFLPLSFPVTKIMGDNSR